ncbi:MAG: hypothetical protein ACE5Z5_09075 [Candidatus Bathyarchaeia archaeon]
MANVLVVYYPVTGNTEAMAGAVAMGASKGEPEAHMDTGRRLTQTAAK